LPEKPWAGRFLLVLAASIATATVYGRYHYLVDALAGLGIALAAILTATSRRSKP
jgi:membrane-associated phospholipid phosphatase